MANRYMPHVWVIPEDDANRQVAQALLLELGVDINRYKVMGPAGGWRHVLGTLERDHAKGMRKFSQRFVVLMIDFDDDPGRLAYAKSEVERIDGSLADRVFVFGVLSEPERLTPEFGSFDDIGEALGRDCRDATNLAWTHPLLSINEPEVARFRGVVCPQLF